MQRDPAALEWKTLGRAPGCVLISALLPDMPNALLVQLATLESGERRNTTLYTVYREDGMTFEAIARFQLPRSSQPLEQVLIHYLRSSDFRTQILAPLQDNVDKHFGRPVARA